MQFRRRIKVSKDVHLNLTRSGLSLSLGPKGMHYSLGPGGSHISVGIPGTGLYYRTKIGGKSKAASKHAPAAAEQAAAAAATSPADARVTHPEVPVVAASPGMLAPAPEKAFYKGCLAYTQQQYADAYAEFQQIFDTQNYIDDARYMGGLAASYLNQPDDAINLLSDLLENGVSPLPGEDGSLTHKYLPDATITVPVTQFSNIERPLDMSAVPFVLADLFRLQNRTDEAIDVMGQMFARSPDLRLLQLALADLYCLAGDYDNLFALTENSAQGLTSEDDVTLEMMYYWAVALTVREMYDAAAEVYKKALAKTSDRNPELVKLVEYGRADMYERWGKQADALRYFQRLYATDPQFYDIADRVSALQAGAQTPAS